MVKTNNEYLKTITDKVGGESTGVHTDNYYLKEISENIGGGTGDLERLPVTVRYIDGTSETINIAVWSDE